MKTILVLLVLVAIIIVSCQRKSAKEVQNMEPKQFAEKLKATENPQLLDVRSPEEFEGGHLENADNVNWNDINFVKTAKQYDKSKPIFVYCKAGVRGRKAANKLAELGFTNIYNLEGGIDKWNQHKTTTN